MSQKQLDEIFNRVRFDELDRDIHTEMYEDVKTIALKIDAICPDSAEKTLCFRALHLALMHAGAALSRQDKYKVIE